VYNAGSGLVVLLFGDPHGLEGGEGGQDGASDPDQELPLSGRDNLDLHGGGGEGSHFLAESLGDAGVHSRAPTHHDVVVEIFTDVHVALQNGLVGDFMEPGHFLADVHGFEEGLGATETLTAHCDHLAVREFVIAVVLIRVFVGFEFSLVV